MFETDVVFELKPLVRRGSYHPLLLVYPSRDESVNDHVSCQSVKLLCSSTHSYCKNAKRQSPGIEAGCLTV